MPQTVGSRIWNTEHPIQMKAYRRKYRLLHPETSVYSNIVQRCTSPKNTHWADYGGRGIKCMFHGSKDIIAAIGHRPTASHTIDRIDNDGHYEAGNVRWATRKTQSNNRRQKCH